MSFLAAIPAIVGAASAAAGTAYSIYSAENAPKKTASGTWVTGSLSPEESKLQTLQMQQDILSSKLAMSELDAQQASKLPPVTGMAFNGDGGQLLFFGVLLLIGYGILKKR